MKERNSNIKILIQHRNSFVILMTVAKHLLLDVIIRAHRITFNNAQEIL